MWPPRRGVARRRDQREKEAGREHDLTVNSGRLRREECPSRAHRNNKGEAMATASENFQLMTDYYAVPRDGEPENVERMASFYTDDKPAYIAGDSALSGTVKNTEEAVQYLQRMHDLNGGGVELVGTPTILLAGDTVAAALIHQRHHREGKSELIVPRLCVYEITDGKLSRAFMWQLESKVFDEYYPR